MFYILWENLIVRDDKTLMTIKHIILWSLSKLNEQFLEILDIFDIN